MSTKTSPWVMGISASHNGAVCLLKGDEVAVAIQEERLTRKKRMNIYGAQGSQAIQYCLDYAGIKPSDLSMVVITVAGEPAVAPVHDLKLNPILQVELNKIPTRIISHHLAHAYSAFATSGMEESAVLVIDGCGSTYEDMFEEERGMIRGGGPDFYEFISLYSAEGTKIRPVEKHASQLLMPFKPKQTGMGAFGTLGGIFQSAATQIFGAWLDAGKVMGLAPYGRPTIPAEEFFEIVDGEFRFREDVPNRFQHSDRWPLRQREYQDLACSVQVALEKALLYLVGRLHELAPSDNLCYAGGVALNSVANERIIRESAFKNVFVIPAAEDSGPAIGAAYYGLWQLTGENTRRRMAHDAVGREYSREEVLRAIEEAPAVEAVDAGGDYLSRTVDLLCAGKSIGWFQGRSELGPRALGQRSIICDPRRPDAKEVLNRRVKHREAFRPFAPAVLLEDSAEWFDWGGVTPESPYMLRVAKFREEKCEQVPAVVHVDGTGRVQTLTREANGPFYDLVERFKERTGVGVLLNTSFNVMGMPIVETPADALHCLQITGLDCCVLGDVIVRKREKVLLGLDAQPDGPGAAVAGPGAGRKGELLPAGPFAHSMKEYEGTFASGDDVLTVEDDGPRLKVHMSGMTTTLEPRGDYFEVTGQFFAGFNVLFYRNETGRVAALKVLVPEDVGQLGSVTFERVERERAYTAEQLRSLAGTYECRGQTLRVVKRGRSELAITADGQPEFTLTPEKDATFSLKNTPGYFIKFEAGAAGAPPVAVLMQPNGRFTLTKTA